MSMSLKEMELAIFNLQNNLNALMSRNTNGRIDDTKGEVRKVEANGNAAIQEVDDSVAETMLLMVEMMKGETE